MCLDLNKSSTSRAIKNRKGTRTFYKVLRVNRGWSYYGVSLVSPYRSGFTYRAGVNKSSRKSRKLSEQEVSYISEGIHVCTTRNRAERIVSSFAYSRDTFAIVPVKCHMRYFVAFGSKEAVFTQITIPKKTYKRFIK